MMSDTESRHEPPTAKVMTDFSWLSFQALRYIRDGGATDPNIGVLDPGRGEMQ